MKPDLSYFTHKATFYGIPVYYNVETDDLAGVNFLCDYLVLFFVALHDFYSFLFSLVDPLFECDGFPIRLKERIECESVE